MYSEIFFCFYFSLNGYAFTLYLVTKKLTSQISSRINKSVAWRMVQNKESSHNVPLAECQF